MDAHGNATIYDGGRLRLTERNAAPPLRCPHCGHSLAAPLGWRHILLDEWDTLRRPDGSEGIPLAPKETALLLALIDQAGGYVRHRRLIEAVWGDAGQRAPETYDGEVKRYVLALRHKLEGSGWGTARRTIRNVSHRGWGLDTVYLASRLP